MSPHRSLFALAAAVALVGCRTTSKPDADTAGISGAVDVDGDGYLDDEDCDDADASTNPGATEVCDGVDNDCDGDIDEGVLDVWYADADEDGYGDPGAPVEACDGPPGAVPTATDCDDADPAVFPSAPERCDGIDNDCDGDIDEDVQQTWWMDADGDGFGDPWAAVESCDPPDGVVDNEDDCDDTDASARPDGVEVCDGVDNDCDGRTDEDAEDAPTWYADVDGDGFGDPDNTTNECEVPTGYVGEARDCDDLDFDVRPGADEVCDGIDNDCDGLVDDADPGVDTATGATWFTDGDGDGFGDAGAAVSACLQPSGTVSDDTDCDDADAAVNPGASEVCNGADDDCDGLVDDADGTVDLSTGGTWYADGDGDGYGDAASPTTACSQPSATVTDATDCDDGDGAVNPGASEVCNGTDDDCDGLTDDADGSVDLSTGSDWYGDADGDGYGDASSATAACSQPSGAVADATDCDDAAAAVNPGASEVCNGIDDDCDGRTDDDDGSVDLSTGSTWYGDADGDGYGAAASATSACSQPSGTVSDATDCDDAAASINPGASEVCNSVDDDCDGLVDDADGSLDTATGSTWYADADGDGYGDPASTTAACTEPAGYEADALDCDDGDASVNPDGDEICDGIDNDCSGTADDLSWSEDFSATVSSSVMSINGSAYQTGGYLELTGTGGAQAGSAFFADPFLGDRWHASFDFSTGGGSGADGLALVWLDTSDPTVVGGAGGGMGFSGLSGYAVELDTYYNGGVDPNGNHVAITDAATFVSSASSTGIPTLENAGWMSLDVWVDGTSVQVAVDGTTYLTSTLSGAGIEDPLLGVTAATGGATNNHSIDNLVIECW